METTRMSVWKLTFRPIFHQNLLGRPEPRQGAASAIQFSTSQASVRRVICSSPALPESSHSQLCLAHLNAWHVRNKDKDKTKPISQSRLAARLSLNPQFGNERPGSWPGKSRADPFQNLCKTMATPGLNSAKSCLHRALAASVV